MPRPKKEVHRSCGHESYDFDDWEGGIAVYWMDGDHGTKIVAVPRFQVSTILMCDASDYSMLISMLNKKTHFNRHREKAEQFASMILAGITRSKAV